MTTNKDYDTLENTQFILKGRLSANENHAEGVTQLFFGFPFTKVLLHTTIEPQGVDSPEIRRASQYLTLPTVVAIELAHLILSTAKQAEAQLLGDLSGEAKSKISSILQDIRPAQSISGLEIQHSTPSSTKAAAKKVK